MPHPDGAAKMAADVIGCAGEFGMMRAAAESRRGRPPRSNHAFSIRGLVGGELDRRRADHFSAGWEGEPGPDTAFAEQEEALNKYAFGLAARSRSTKVVRG